MEQSDTDKKTQEKHQEKSSKDKKAADSPFETLSKNVSSIGSRLRVLEERYSNVRKKTQMVDSNILSFERDMREEIRIVNKDLLDMKKSIAEIKDKIFLMHSEIQKTVNQNDFKVLEKYVEMWQPMDFVTREEFNKLINNK